jgi:hypothetical protein
MVTITAVDQVGQLGQARIEDETLSGGYLHEQLPDVFGFAGLSPTVRQMPLFGPESLDGIASLSGSVAQWMSDAEEVLNATIAPNAAGEIIICYRDLSDYWDRLRSDFYIGTEATSVWIMKESSGTVFDFGSGTSHDATPSGTPTYGLDGPWGANGPKAIGFQKADAADQLSVGDFYDLTGGTWDIGVWFYWDGSAASQSTIMSKLATGPNNGWLLAVTTGGVLRFQTYDAGVQTTLLDAPSAVTANRWYHANVSASGGTVRLQLNGVTVDSDTLGTIPNTAASLRFGSLAGSTQWWGGRLCMASIWNTFALTQAQMLALIYLGKIELSGALEPYRWTRTESITTVVNHWIFRQSGVTSSTDAGSVAAYGDRTWEITAGDVASGAIAGSYSAVMEHLTDPRPVISCAFHVTGSAQQDIVTREPLDYVTRDGEEWQVMSIQHDITVGSWEVTMTLAETVPIMTSSGTALPA